MKIENISTITVSAVRQLLIITFFMCLALGVFFHYTPEGHILDVIILMIDCVILICALVLFSSRQNIDLNKVILLYLSLFLFTLAPITLFYIYYGWLGEWRFVDEFPPVTGLSIISIALCLFILPKAYKNYIFLIWASQALPILLYLTFNPDELHSPRGYELIVAFGPASLLLYLVLPYRKGLRNLYLKVHDDMQKFANEATHDFLTGLNNRRGLMSWLNTCRPDDTIGVMLIDVDHFKSINDQYGHAIGDEVLAEVSACLQTLYTQPHSLARWGGEEFAIVLLNPNATDLAAIASRVQMSLSTFHYRSVDKVTVSVGVSHLAGLEHFNELIEQADKALYFAKEHGRNQAILYNSNTM